MKARAVIVGGIAISAMGAIAPAQAVLPPSPYACTKMYSGEEIDLSPYRLVFSDEFDEPSIVGGPGKGIWFAAQHSTFGRARFMALLPGDDTYVYANGTLTIRLQQKNAVWQSGLLQTVDGSGKGLAFNGGYFEMRAKFEPGGGNWPAFWLKTVNEYTAKNETRGEFDIIEAYGGQDRHGYHSSIHLWPAAQKSEHELAKHWGKSCYRRVTDLFDGQFHTYGVDVTADRFDVYFDHKNIATYPMLPVFQQPLYILLNLALSNAEDRRDERPSDMVVDWVRVYQK